MDSDMSSSFAYLLTGAQSEERNALQKHTVSQQPGQPVCGVCVSFDWIRQRGVPREDGTTATSIGPLCSSVGPKLVLVTGYTWCVLVHLCVRVFVYVCVLGCVCLCLYVCVCVWVFQPLLPVVSYAV